MMFEMFNFIYHGYQNWGDNLCLESVNVVLRTKVIKTSTLFGVEFFTQEQEIQDEKLNYHYFTMIFWFLG